jgi:VWFA-related protein
MKSRLTLLWLPLFALLAISVASGRQNPAPPAQPATALEGPQATPPIRVTTRLVQVGVTVHDKSGAVSGLTQSDFTIFDRGKPQPVSFFSVLASGTASVPAEPLPPNTFSDLPKYSAAAPGSITIVLLDNLNTLYGTAPSSYEETPFWTEDHALANAKAHLLEYLKNLNPQDRVAIYGLREGLHVLCDFTSDRGRLLDIVSHYDPRSRTSRETVEPEPIHTPNGADFDPHIDVDRLEMAAMQNEDRGAATLAALQAIADHVANIPGRKNLVWLTANLPFSASAIARILSPAQIAAYPVDGRGLMPQSLIKTLRDGAYADELMMGMGPSQQSPDPTGVDVMIRLADLTGGKAFVNTNDLTGAIREAVDDAAVLYVLGFYIDAKSADGQFHELKVEVKPAGLRVRYPKGYFAYKDAPSTQDEIRNNWVTALRSPIESSAIPLEARIERVNEPTPHTLDIRGTIDVHPLRLAEKGQRREGEVDVIIVEQDQTGKVVSRSVNRLTLRMTAEQYASAMEKGIRFEKHVEPRAEAATLRILVQDPGSAQVGSLIIPLSQIQ